MLPALKKLRTAAGTLLGLVTVVLIAGCERSDPDATRMQNLAARGYSLSVADFHRAACAGDTLALEQFLECGTRVDVPLVENGRAQTALRAAVKNGHDGAAAFLIEQGASLAKADETDKPRLLELAIASGNESLARLLLAHPDLPRHELPPLLLEASRQGEVGLMEALLDHEPGLSLDACLLESAAHGHIGMTDFLLQHQARPDTAEPATQRTALMLAAAGGYAQVIDLLLTAGAARFLADAEGLLAADHALRGGHAAEILWRPLSRAEREIGVPPSVDDTAPPENWTQEAPAVPVLPVRADPDQPRHLLPLRFALAGHHSGLVTPPPPRLRVELHGTRPAQLPFHPVAVREAELEVEFLDQPGAPASYSTGGILGKTGWSVVEIRLRAATPLPQWLDGLAIIRHAQSGTQMALVPGAAARHGPLCALIHIAGTDEYYEGHAGDVFRLTGTQQPLTLLEIQPRRARLCDAAGEFWIDLNPAH